MAAPDFWKSPAPEITPQLPHEGPPCDPSFFDDLPTWSSRSYAHSPLTGPMKRRRDLVPDTLEGDFDGDGELDVAISVESCRGGSVGVVILLRSPSDQPRVFGAGDGTDMSWLSYWFVTHDPNSPDLLDLAERCTLGAERQGAPIELDCSS